MLLLSLLASLLALAPIGVAGAQAGSPDLVISQVYGGGGNSGAPFDRDYVELFNRGADAASTEGLSVQYASTAGSFGQQVALPAASVPPGGYYLIQMAGGTSGGSSLPTPDLAPNSPNMAAANGKVALVDGQTNLGCGATDSPCDGSQLASILDLVGYGTANLFEGSAAAPAGSNSLAIIRLAGGCTDTDDNGDDLVTGAPAPRNSAAAPQPCAGLNQQIVPDCPATVRVHDGFGTETTLTATDPDGTVVTATITDGGSEAIMLVDADPATDVGGTYTVILASAGLDVGTYPADITFTNDDAEPQTATCTVTITVVEAGSEIGIHAVQGPGSSTPLANQTVTIEGVATSVLLRSRVIDGFFLQEDEADYDDDDLTSEGIFVFCRDFCPEVDVRDRVRVTGVAGENFGMTQVTARAFNGGVMSIGDGDQTLPAAVPLTLPAAARTDAESTFESVEGMIVSFPQTLTVDEYFQLDRFGQITLSAGDRPVQFTMDDAPSVEGFAAHQDELASRRIILDDDTNDQNPYTAPPVDLPYPYPSPGLSIDNYVRGGDTIDGLTGVMHWSFAGASGTDAWRLRPIPEVEYTFDRVNERTDAPSDVGGSMTVANFNVLNYFTTLNNPGNTCGPEGLGCRGANSDRELERQRAKIVAALAAIDADIVGLIELENDADDASIADLVAGLNDILGAGTYDHIETGFVGTDAIKNGLIYKPGTVSPVGELAILDSTVDTRFDDTRSRPVLVQTFEELATEEEVTVAVNHLKSKGCGGATGDDADQLDGAACWNPVRTDAAEALRDFMASDPTETGVDRYLVMGDLNSYRMEDPIRVFTDAGYTDLASQFIDRPYSFLFGGQIGTLDYALSNAELTPFVTGIDEWHINADEVPLFDYNDEILDPNEQPFNRVSAATEMYEPTPFRSSDHDPIIVGFDLVGDASPTAPVADAGGPYTVRVGQQITFDASASAGEGLSFAWDLDDDGQFDDAVGPQPRVRITGPPGVRQIGVQVTDVDGQVDVDTTTLTVTTAAGTVPPPFTPPADGPDDEGPGMPPASGQGRIVNVAPGTAGEAIDPTEVSIALSRLTNPDGNSFAQVGGTVLLASDTVFADALASGTLQTDGRPLLLNDRDALEPAVLEEIRRLRATSVRILGGVAAIGADVEDALIAEGLVVARTAGATRTETAIAVAELADVGDAVLVARSFPADGGEATQAFADSLALGGLAAVDGTAVVLSQTEELTQTTRTFLSGPVFPTATLVGGPSALSTAVEDAVVALGSATDRIEGPNRFATAVAVATARGFTPDAPAARVIVIEGQAEGAWAGGFAAAALSSLTDAPILLVNGDDVPTETEAFLTSAVELSEDGVAVTCAATSAACDALAAILDV